MRFIEHVGMYELMYKLGMELCAQGAAAVVVTRNELCTHLREMFIAIILAFTQISPQSDTVQN